MTVKCTMQLLVYYSRGEIRLDANGEIPHEVLGQLRRVYIGPREHLVLDLGYELFEKCVMVRLVHQSLTCADELSQLLTDGFQIRSVQDVTAEELHDMQLVLGFTLDPAIVTYTGKLDKPIAGRKKVLPRDRRKAS